MESLQAADAGRVGERAPRAREGRRELRVVAKPHAVAAGQQPPCAGALQRVHAGLDEERLQGEAAAFRPSDFHQVPQGQRRLRATQPAGGGEHGIQRPLPGVLPRARPARSSGALSQGTAGVLHPHAHGSWRQRAGPLRRLLCDWRGSRTPAPPLDLLRAERGLSQRRDGPLRGRPGKYGARDRRTRQEGHLHHRRAVQRAADGAETPLAEDGGAERQSGSPAAPSLPERNGTGGREKWQSLATVEQPIAVARATA